MINALKSDGKEVIAFAPYYQRVVESMASQAGVAITNTQLIENIEELFNSFVKVMAAAIDSRTPYNAHHSRRVAMLARGIAEAINCEKNRPWDEVYFDEEELDQLTMAGWLHDIGKLAVPLVVMNKATRLGDRFELIMKRLDFIYRSIELDSLKKQKNFLLQGQKDKVEEEIIHLKKELAELRRIRNLILEVNNPDVRVEEELVKQIKEIAVRKYQNLEGEVKTYLSQDEVDCLSVRIGTLTSYERKIMEDHVNITNYFLEKIPFRMKFSKVPLFVSMHHEYLDGKGYPLGLKGKDIPLEARILTLVDVYDALTAGDRPYKKAIEAETALHILNNMVDEGKIDTYVFEIFKKYEVWKIC